MKYFSSSYNYTNPLNAISTGVCELYGDPHYISFEGVNFDFIENCTYVLVEEVNPVYNLTIAVDNYYCMPQIRGSCVKGIILKYKMNTATLNIYTNANGEKEVQVNNFFFLSFFIHVHIHMHL